MVGLQMTFFLSLPNTIFENYFRPYIRPLSTKGEKEKKHIFFYYIYLDRLAFEFGLQGSEHGPEDDAVEDEARRDQHRALPPELVDQPRTASHSTSCKRQHTI